MPNIDRQIGISGGWVAGPSAGLAMMAAPDYLHLHPLGTAVCFWLGIVVFFLSAGHMYYVQIRERNRKLNGPVALICLGALFILLGAAWEFWPGSDETSEKKLVQNALVNKPQFEEIRDLLGFLSGKNENELIDLFDFDGMLTLNTRMFRDKIPFVLSGRHESSVLSRIYRGPIEVALPIKK